jgi:hypothetical protein
MKNLDYIGNKEVVINVAVLKSILIREINRQGTHEPDSLGDKLLRQSLKLSRLSNKGEIPKSLIKSISKLLVIADKRNEKCIEALNLL